MKDRRHSPSYSCGAEDCLTCAEARARKNAELLERCVEARRFFGETANLGDRLDEAPRG